LLIALISIFIVGVGAFTVRIAIAHSFNMLDIYTLISGMMMMTMVIPMNDQIALLEVNGALKD
jgi:hypothetical protein